eukprot:scaffold17877_cov66-Phaeocystis_antarctica.AAC.3
MALSSSITTVRRHSASAPQAPPLAVSASATAAAQPSCCGVSPFGNGTPLRLVGARARKISRLDRPPTPATNFEVRGARAIAESRPCTIVHGCGACEWRERKPSLHAREALRGRCFEGGAAVPLVPATEGTVDHWVCRLHQRARKADESALEVAAVEGGVKGGVRGSGFPHGDYRVHKTALDALSVGGRKHNIGSCARRQDTDVISG